MFILFLSRLLSVHNSNVRLVTTVRTASIIQQIGSGVKTNRFLKQSKITSLNNMNICQSDVLRGCLRLVQSFQLSFILIILLYYRYIHFLFSNTPMKAKTVTTCSFRIWWMECCLRNDCLTSVIALIRSEMTCREMPNFLWLICNKTGQ